MPTQPIPRCPATLRMLAAAGMMLLSPMIGRSQDSRDTRPADLPGMKEAFDLLDKLGTPDTSSCPFVEVKPVMRSGRWSGRTLGFMTDEKDGTFIVWLLSLELRSFRKERGDRYEVLSFEAEAPRLLQYLANGRTESSPDHEDAMFDMLPLGMRTELISLSRECARRGLDELAGRCCSTALGMKIFDNRGPVKRGTLPSIVKEETELAWIWRATLACGDPDVGRDDLLAAFARCERSFPEGRFIKMVSEVKAQLEVMVEEDIRHRAANRSLDGMTQEQRIEELIFQLRDQHGGQFIAAIEILEQIAGRQFFRTRSTFSYPLKDGLEDEVRAEVRKWWDGVMPKAAESRPAESRPR